MKRSSRLNNLARTQLLVAIIMMIFATACGFFGWSYYLSKSTAWMVIFALASSAFGLACYFHISEWSRLKTLAFREACEELGVFSPPRGSN